MNAPLTRLGADSVQRRVCIARQALCHVFRRDGSIQIHSLRRAQRPRTFRFGGYKHAPLAAYRTDLIDDSVVLVCHRQRLRELGDQYVPGQQVTDAIDWVLCDADEHVTQIGFGIDAV